MREIDEDERREAIDEQRRYLRATRCRCGGDMPGYCPGPSACPMCADDRDEETGDE